MTANRRHRRIRQPRCLQDRLYRAAQAAGVSESELAREAIDDYLAKEPEPALRHVPHRQCTLCISMGMGSGSVSVRSGGCGVRGDGEGLGRSERGGAGERCWGGRVALESSARWCEGPGVVRFSLTWACHAPTSRSAVQPG